MDKALRQGDKARRDGDKGLSDRQECKDKCCGGPPPCAWTSGEPCRPGPKEEFAYRWQGQNITEVFRRQTDCCCIPSQYYRRFFQRMGYIAYNGQSCVQQLEGEGVNPITVRYRVWYNGVLQVDDSFLDTVWTCAPGCYYVGQEGCRYHPGIGSGEGEYVSTCRECYGWWVGETSYDTRFSQWSDEVYPIDNICAEGCFACCTPWGGCLETSPEECAAMGGTYNSGKHCGDPEIQCRPQQTGACCRNYSHGGGCSQTTREQCEKEQGFYLGDGSSCASSPCPVITGACCLPDGTCIQADYNSCVNAGGDYRGNGTACGGVNCPQPIRGACCYPNGFCQLLTNSECLVAGGQFAGPNTVCDQSTCPTGACCTPGGSCAITSAFGCSQLFGWYRGDGTTCDDPNYSCLGCCCVGDQGFVTSASQCFLLGGIWHGPNTVCVINPERGGGHDISVPTQVDCGDPGKGGIGRGQAPYSLPRLHPRAMPFSRGCSKCGMDKGL